MNREEDLDLPKLSSPMRSSSELAEEPSNPETKDQHKCNDYHITSTTNEFSTPQKKEGFPYETECLAVSPIPEWRTPLANLTNTNRSASEDWRGSSGEKSGTLGKPRKLKRLRRLGDGSSAVKGNNPGIAKADLMGSRCRREKHVRGNWFCVSLHYIQ